MKLYDKWNWEIHIVSTSYCVSLLTRKLTFRTKVGMGVQNSPFFCHQVDGPSLGQKHSKICWLKSSTKSTLGFLELGLGLGFLIARLTGIGLVGRFAPLRFVGLDTWSTFGPNWYWFQQCHLLALFLACFPCFALAIWLWLQC
jgi:hypothetical protein